MNCAIVLWRPRARPGPRRAEHAPLPSPGLLLPDLYLYLLHPVLFLQLFLLLAIMFFLLSAGTQRTDVGKARGEGRLAPGGGGGSGRGRLGGAL